MIIKYNLKCRSVDKPSFICIENFYHGSNYFIFMYTHRVEYEYIYYVFTFFASQVVDPFIDKENCNVCK